MRSSPSSAVSRQRPRRRLRAGFACSASIIGLFAPAMATPAHAQTAPVMPSGGNVTAGSATIAASGNTVTVQQSSSRAVVTWQDFSIGSGGTVGFEGPGNAAILNRVTGPNASQINGTLRAAGTSVYIVNQNGITIGPGGVVNSTEGFVAATLGISDDAFMAGGVLRFSGTGGTIRNSGTINSSGIVGLLATEVINDGLIAVPKGRIALGSGEAMTLDPSGDGFLQVLLPTGTVETSGRLEADGGRIVLSANQIKTFSPVFVPAAIRADRVEGRDGSIELIAVGAAKTVNLPSGPVVVASAGRITSAAVTSANGGSISMSGEEVFVTRALSADAGGTVSITGILRATLVSTITANATGGSNADAGRIDVTAPEVTVSGTLAAKAGDGGRGGLVRIGGAFAFGAPDDGSAKFARFSGQYGALPALQTAGQQVEVSATGTIDVAGGRGGTLIVSGARVAFNGVWDAGANGAVSIASLPLGSTAVTLDGLANRLPSDDHFRTDWLVVGGGNLLITDPADAGNDADIIAELASRLTFPAERESFLNRFARLPRYGRLGTDWIGRMVETASRVQIEASDTLYWKGNLLAATAAPQLSAFSLLAGQAVYVDGSIRLPNDADITLRSGAADANAVGQLHVRTLDGRFAPVVDVRGMSILAPLGGYRDASLTLAPGTSLVNPGTGFARVANLSYASESDASLNRLVLGGTGARLALSGTITAPQITLTGALLIDADTRIVANTDTIWTDQATQRITGSAGNPTIAIGRRRSGAEEILLAGRVGPGNATWINLQFGEVEYGASDEAIVASMGAIGKGALRDGDTLASVLGRGLFALPLGSRSSSGLLQAGTYGFDVALGRLDLSTLQPGYVFLAPQSGGTGVVVTPREVSVALPSEIRTIFGESLTGLQPAGIIAGDVVGVGLSLTDRGGAAFVPGVTGAGRYTASLAGLTGSDAANYVLPASSGSQSAQLLVDRRAITITPDSVTRLYGDALSPTGSFSAALTQGVAGQSGSALAASDQLAATIEIGSPTDGRSGVGTYELRAGTARFDIGDPANYAISYAPGVLTIDPARLTLSSAPNSKIFGEADPALAVTVSGLRNEESLASVITAGLVATVAENTAGQAIARIAGVRAAGEDVGTYAWTGLSGLSLSPNYTIAAADFSAAQLTVTPRNITITPQAISRVYGNDNPASAPFTVALTPGVAGQTGSALRGGDTLAATIAVATDATRFSTNERSYDLIGSGASFLTGDSANYLITYATGVGALSITRRPVTFSMTPTSFTYGEASGRFVTINGLIPGDEVSPIAAQFQDSLMREILGRTPLIPVDGGFGLDGLLIPGAYLMSVRLEGARAGMYDLRAPGTTGFVTVLRRNLDIRALASSYTYGDPKPIMSVSGLLPGDVGLLNKAIIKSPDLPDPDFQIAASGTYTWQLPARVQAQTPYQFRLVNWSDGAIGDLQARYNFTSLQGRLLINPIVLSPLDRTVEFGAEDLNPLFDNVLSGDRVGLRSLSFGRVVRDLLPVGVYSVTNVNGLSTDNPNYVLSSGTYTLTVAPRVVEYAIDASSSVYGNPTEIALVTTRPIPARLGSPVINLATTGGQSAGVPGTRTPVGSYIGTLAGFGTYSASNFVFRRIGEASANITVTPRPLTLLPNSQMLYGSAGLGPDAFLAATASSGLANGEIITFSNTGGGSPVPGSSLDVGRYRIDGLSFGPEASNYAITIPSDAALTIAPRPVSINLFGGSKLYDGTGMMVGSLSGLVNNDRVGLVLTNIENRNDFLGNPRTHDYSSDIFLDGDAIVTSGGACLCDLSITGLSGERARNYVLSMPAGVQYEIRRRAIPISLLGGEIQYGTPTATLLSVNNPRFLADAPLRQDLADFVPVLSAGSETFDAWAKANGAPGVIFGRSEATLFQNFGTTLLDAGLYTFRLADLGGAGGRNYMPIADPGTATLTVNRAPLTVTLKSDMLYGNAIYSGDPAKSTCGASDVCSMRDDPRPLFTVTGSTFGTGTEVLVRLSSAANGVFGLFASPSARNNTTDLRLFEPLADKTALQIGTLAALPGGKYDVAVALTGSAATNFDVQVTNPEFIIGPRTVGFTFAPNPADSLGIYQYIQRFGYVGPPAPQITLTGVLPNDLVQVVTGVTTDGVNRTLISPLDTATPGEYIITAVGLLADARNYRLADQTFGFVRLKITEPITQLAFSGSLGSSSSAGASGIFTLGTALNIARPTGTGTSPTATGSPPTSPLPTTPAAPPATNGTNKVDPANALTLSRDAVGVPTGTSGSTSATSTDTSASAGAGGSAGGSTSTPIGQLGAGTNAQVGANAGLGGASAGGQANAGTNLNSSTPVGDVTAGVGATAAAAAKISLISLSPSVSVSAKATIEAYVELVNKGNLGGGVEGSSTLRAGGLAGTTGTSKLEVKNGILSVATESMTGAGGTAGAAGTVDLGQVALNAGAQVFTPGIVGLGFVPTAGVEGDTIRFNASVTIATGLGGIKLEGGLAMDTGTAVDGLKSFVSALVDAGLKKQECEICDWKADAARTAQRLSALDPLADPSAYLTQVSQAMQADHWPWMDRSQMDPILAKAENARSILAFVANAQPLLKESAEKALKPFLAGDLSQISGDDVMALRAQFNNERQEMAKLQSAVTALGGSLTVGTDGALTITPGGR